MTRLCANKATLVANGGILAKASLTNETRIFGDHNITVKQTIQSVDLMCHVQTNYQNSPTQFLIRISKKKCVQTSEVSFSAS